MSHSGQSMAVDARFSEADVGDILDTFLLHHHHPVGRSQAPSPFDPSEVFFASDPLGNLPEAWQPDVKDAVVVGFSQTSSQQYPYNRCMSKTFHACCDRYPQLAEATVENNSLFPYTSLALPGTGDCNLASYVQQCQDCETTSLICRVSDSSTHPTPAFLPHQRTSGRCRPTPSQMCWPAWPRSGAHPTMTLAPTAGRARGWVRALRAAAAPMEAPISR